MANKKKTTPKYYAVAKGKAKTPAIFTTWAKCKKATLGVSGAKFKKFDNLTDAEKYINDYCKSTKTIVTEPLLIKDRKPRKICPICEKPHSERTQCCRSCHIKMRACGSSIVKITNLMRENVGCDIWELIKEKPYLATRPLLDKKLEAHQHKTKFRSEQRTDDYKNHKYSKMERVPDYILDEMKKYPTRKLIGITGDRIDPLVHYECSRCNEDQVIQFSQIWKAHDCIGTKSSGQVIVEDFLKDKYDYVIEHATFQCISPVTKRQLPYDIEITGKNVLIEIQGHQHLKFVPHFHGSEENFAYQQRKDSYKKRWAESKGYRVLYIYYEDFKDDQYKEKILNFIRQ